MSVVIQFFKELGPVKLLIAAISLLFFILIFSFYLYKVSNKEMMILYSDLDLSDSNRIIQELESKQIPYEIAAGGKVIRVPDDQVLKLRVTMAQLGVPNKGSIIGYEIFDKEESLGSTSFVQNIKMLRALEGELSRTIESFDQVDKARVHLVIPKRELFSKERQETRASIILKMKGNRTLGKAEIDAVSHLIASAVPELDLKNVTIVDTKGKSLKLGMQDDAEVGYGSSINEDRRLAYEVRLKHVIEELLTKTLGANKVLAQVHVEMDFNRVVSNKEWYDPDGAVLRSTQTIEENERNPLGGEDNADSSVANNLPGGGQGQDGGGNVATLARSDETKNYEIPKTVTNEIKDIGVVSKLSVAVLIDGVYKPSADGQTSEYQPRSEEELKKIEGLVKVAVGFNEERQDQLEVINMPFSADENAIEAESTTQWLKQELPNMLQTIVVAAVIILIFLSVVRPIALRAFDVRKEELNIDPLVKEQLGDGIEGIAISDDDVMLSINRANAAGAASIKKINESIEQHPQETLMLIRKWLNEEK